MKKRRKSRKQKQIEYDIKYREIPRDYQKRLEYMTEKYNLSEKKMEEIINKKNYMENNLFYKDLLVVLYEEPEGTPRPRFRLVNRKNLANEAMNNGSFVHVYSINAHEDHVYMEKMVDDELEELNSLIYTPCIVEYNIFMKIPSAFNITDKFLAEIGIIRPLNKPDWDNIGKKYSDMYNENVWLDDTLVITGTVNRYYSELPRVEIHLRYLNQLYNKYQYNSIVKRIDKDNIEYINFNNRRHYNNEY